MANDKKFVVKNGLTTSNIEFKDDINNGTNTITASMLSTDALSFSGDSGQLFSITDSLTGTIFSVNDISGIPSVEVDDDGTIRLAEFAGNVLIGTATDDGTNKLQLTGDAKITGNFETTGNISVTGTVDGRDIAADGTKLDGIESGATADQTAAEILTAIKTVDGAGSGLDADLLDGQQGSYYLDYNNLSNTPGSGAARTEEFPTVTNGSAAVTMNGNYAIDKIDVFLNGAKMKGGTDYTVSGTTLTFSENLQTGDVVALYVYNTDVLITADWNDLNDVSVTGASANDLVRYNGSSWVIAPASIDSSGNLTVSGYLAGPSTFTIDPAGVGDNTGTVVIAGDLQVGGTTITVNSQEVAVGDKVITLGSDATADTQNNGAGIKVYRPDSFDASFLWDETNDEWDLNTNFNISGNLIISGTVDGRDVAADGSKLDGIEAGATADQTASEILTAIKTVDGSGSGLDADTLDGIQGSGFLQTSGGTLTGALSGTSLSLSLSASGTQFIGTAQSTTAPTTDDAKFDGFGVQGNRTTNPVYVHNQGAGGVRISSNASLGTANGILVKDTVTDISGNLTISGTVDGRDVAADGTKLDGIETGATADQTASEILTLIKTVDGTGSGLDADLLDGIQASAITQSGDSVALTGDVTGSTTVAADGAISIATTIAANSVALGTDTSGNYVATITGTANEVEVSGSGSESAAVTIGLPNDVTIGNDLTVTGDLIVNGTTTTVNSNTVEIGDSIITLNSDEAGTPSQNAGIEVERGTSTNVQLRWNETNDKWEVTEDGAAYSNILTTADEGTGNGLDADTVDGIEASSFLRSDAADVKTSGDLRFDDNIKAVFGSSNDLQVYHDGSNSYVYDTGTGELRLRGSTVRLQSAAGETLADFTEDGAARLHYDNAVKIATTSTGVDVTGNIVVSGTVDGRDVAADGTKLDGIEAGATADQTQSEINALGITATGLSGTPNITVGTLNATEFDGHIEAGANLDINVGSNYGTTTTPDRLWISTFITGQSDVPANYIDIINLSSASTHGIQIASSYGAGAGQFYMRNRSDNVSAPAGVGLQAWKRLYHQDYHPEADSWTTARTITLSGDLSGNVSIDGSTNVTLNATVADDSHNHVISNIDGLQTELDGKLNSSSYTASDVLTKIKTVDGTGSGLDADTLDGQEGTYYLDGANFTGTLPNDYVTLGTMTTGNYVATVTGTTNQVDVTGSGSETAAVTVSLPDTVTLGSDDTSRGSLYLYGDGTGSAFGGFIRLYNPADHDTTNEYFTIKAQSNQFVVEKADGTDLFTYIDSDTSFRFPDGTVYVGSPDNTKGNLYIQGDGAGSVNGGEIRIYNAADHDTNVNYYSLYAESEDFLISYGSNDFLQYDYSASKWVMPQSGGLSVTGNITVSGTVDGRDVAADGTKLDGIEAGATADQTASEILTAIKTVDGTGSGLDADTVDGVEASSFLRSDAADTATGLITLNGGLVVSGASTAIISRGTDSETVFQSTNESASNANQFYIQHNLGNVNIGNSRGNINFNAGTLQYGGNTVLTEASTQSKYLRSDTNDDFSGTLNYTPDTGTILSVDGQAILQRMTANGAITIGHDDAVIIAGGDTSDVLNTNINNANETIFLGAEGGLVIYAFPNNDTTWTNRKTLSFDGANGLDMNSVFAVDINGNLSAATKSFVIDHPTKEGMKLRHGSLEGPENGVYVRGRLTNSNTIELPEYWLGLVDEDSITVQLTAIGTQQNPWVKKIVNNTIVIEADAEIDCFYMINAERKDVKRFEVEYNG